MGSSVSFAAGLTASLEDYLEAISRLVRENRVARAKDIASRLGVSMSSVTGALHSLSARGLIEHEPYGYVVLTRRGKKVADQLVRRHEVICDFLTRVLGIDEATAQETACRMEHAVDERVLGRLVEFAEFVEKCPRAGSDWIRRFHGRCAGECAAEDCAECVQECMDALGGGAG